MFPYRRLFILLLFVSLFLSNLAFGTPVRAAGLVVDSLADTKTVDKVCTLREAIENASKNQPTNPDCAAGDSAGGADTITFSVKGTILLKSTLPHVFGRNGLTIDGGNNIVINGNKKVSIFIVDTVALLTLQNITIQDGLATGNLAGGMTINGATVKLINATFTKNVSTLAAPAAIALKAGKLNIEGSLFTENNGMDFLAGTILGGFDGPGEIVVNHSTFTKNQGGAIKPQTASLTVENSTFIDNMAGTVFGFTGPMTITNSTLATSEEDSAVLISVGVTVVTNSTLIGNSSKNPRWPAVLDIDRGRTTLRNSIIANTNPLGKNCLVKGIINTNGAEFNLSNDDSCKGFGKTNKINLGPLADNGGPTQTFGLLAGSAAHGKGDPKFCPETDQRGEKRSKGAACDLGAVEGIIGENTSATIPATSAAIAEATEAVTS
jgi:CSLREA domain-containing protein